MEANELRIGNLVECNGIKEVYNIYSNGWDFLYEDIDCRFVEYNNTKPIPLTKEWLLKFGFEFGVKLQDFVKGKHQFVELNYFNGYFSENGILYFNNYTQIKYVHQLQNLYFLLTNEELKINL